MWILILWFGLNSWTKPTLEPKVNFFELVLVPEPITFEPKSTIPPSHIILLGIGIDYNDSVMIFQEWPYEGDNFHDRILHGPIHIGDCKYVNKKEVNKNVFRELPHSFDWVAMLGPIRPPPEPPPWGTLSFPFFFFMHLFIHSYIKDNACDKCGGGF